MLPQFTVYAKIIYLLMVVISGALCTVEDYVIMSQCAHNKAIHLAAEGTVSVTDISQIQNITIVGLTDYVNNEFKIALFAKETQRYLCFNDNWRLVGMKELRDTCYFNETIVHGYFVFRSVVDLQRRVGFTHRGKPVGPKKSVNDACYMFNKIDAEQFFHQHTLPKWRETAATMANGSSGSHSGNYRKVSRNKNNRHKSNNQNQKLQQQQHAHHGHNSSNSLSSTNKTQQQQLALVSKQQQQQMQQQQREQHQVRHHHNDPSVLARRKQRRKQQQQQQQRQEQQQQQRVTASPTKLTTAKSAKSTTSTAATTTEATAKTTKISLASKRKGRRRKARKQKQQQQQQLQQQELQQLQLLSTAATLDSSIDDMLSSSSSSSFSTGYDDAYSSSSSSEPWTTWYATPTATIDSFTPDVGRSSTTTSASNMLLTTTAEDSIKPYSRIYDDGSTFITELENEASGATTVSAATSSSGNDTDLLQYEAEVVEDDEIEQHTTANYETKATATATTRATSAGTTTATTIPTTSSRVAKTTSTTTAAATTITTTTTAATSAVTGAQLVLEQTPLAATLATLMYNKWHTTQQHVVDAVPANTTATAASEVTTATTSTTSGTTAAATRSGLAMSTHKLSRHRGIGSSASPSEQQQQLLRDSNGKQQQQLQLHKLLRPATIVTTSSTQLLTPLATAAAAAPKTVTAAAAAAAATVVVVATPQQHITDKLFSVYKNINSSPNNTLTETAPTATATIATTATTITTKKSLRKSTQKLLATPYHQLTYVRNEAGDIDIDNLDNISVYPDVFEDILNDNDDSSSNSTATNSNSNSRLTFVSGFLATSPTSVLPESIRIAKIKINNERRRLQQRSHRRLRSFS
ncbi:PREDICTED: putative GPI-anchored protein PB15E9.01c isoform X3 [Drosophila arizonae]|uniref:GPI-anchored protein PB15E9.01c isoform X3 n=1 Tax=Drosophila arizonae TaxID=7263 RepID=A0ABM1PF12_DROAR|nr:PREDICTED: putative GPI-anchored protein PB15E9.01c isoform X3 [Drosophila arizonae]